VTRERAQGAAPKTLSSRGIVIRIAGESGEGVISSGDMFTQAAARVGHHVFTFRTYPAEIKGGHAWYQIRINDRPLLSMGDSLDVLITLNAEGYYRHIQELAEGGVLIYDPDTVEPQANGKYILYPLPLNSIARQNDFVRGKNLVLLGAVAALFGLDPSSLEGVIRRRLARRAELLDKNLVSLNSGYEYVLKNIAKEDPYQFSKTEAISRVVMSGNEAIVAGALVAGCRYYAGYPITPASDIMELMARELPRIGGVFLQAEDEIASITSCIGASIAGAKAMTATSGPGLSLMVEGIGLASMEEVPVVIVDAQRSGPSTGMPSKMEQGDLNLAIFGSHGDAPRIVVSPTSVEDCFYQTINAFNLAEKYQMPVILLSDQSLSHRTETMEKPNVAEIEIVERLRPGPNDVPDYRRFRVTETGVSPMAIPGRDNALYTASGLEHDEYGHPNYEPETHQTMTRKRFRKLEVLAEEQPSAPIYGDEDAEIGIITWGSTAGPVREAVEIALEEGYRVKALVPSVVYPLKESQIRDFLASCRKVLVPEANYQGQFARHLAATFGVSLERLNKFTGLPFKPGEIYRKIQELAEND
jgi:2-oxoglutarate ferredoxin oxidoreductase subunit alpha